MLDGLFGNRVEVAISRLKEFESLTDDKGFYLAFSGGKDSCVIKALADMAGVKYDAHYSVTTIDPPELIYFMRKHHPDITWHRQEQTFLQKVQTKGMPTRMGRWCCEYLKEGGGEDRLVVTGVRWGESPRRAKRGMFESCYRSAGKRYLHPIIDWSTKDVWTYLQSRGLRYCSLYDVGSSGTYKGDGLFKRLGCVLCPMTSYKETIAQSLRWPKIAEAWRRAAYRYYERGTPGMVQWESAEAYWQWWLLRKGQPKESAQCVMFD